MPLTRQVAQDRLEESTAAVFLVPRFRMSPIVYEIQLAALSARHDPISETRLLHTRAAQAVTVASEKTRMCHQGAVSSLSQNPKSPRICWMSQVQ
jgi:hypothetical protein